MNNFAAVSAKLGQYSHGAGGNGYTLHRMRRFMAVLGNPQDAYPVIHVAGTSGKTSTSYYIDALMRSQGYKTGLVVSPHIDVIAERAQINGALLQEPIFCAEFSEFIVIVDSYDEPLTYFEIMVAFAFWEFKRQNVDYAIVEVGLGGLLDPTNVVTRQDKIAVITDIGMDHSEILGDTLAKIAGQKAGIIMPNGATWMHRQPSEVMDAIIAIARDKHASINIPKINIMPNSSVPLFQVRNAELALASVESVVGMQIADDAIQTALQTYVPARMELILFNDKQIILDGSHNPQKLRALADSIHTRFGGQSISGLVSFGENKRDDVAQSLAVVRSITDQIILTNFDLGPGIARTSIPPPDLAQICHTLNFTKIQQVADPKDAFNILMRQESDALLVTGSYFLLNHIRPQLDLND